MKGAIQYRWQRNKNDWGNVWPQHWEWVYLGLRPNDERRFLWKERSYVQCKWLMCASLGASATVGVWVPIQNEIKNVLSL